MASCSQKSAAKANLVNKRKLEDGLQTEPILKRHRDLSEEKETTKEQVEGRVELLETNSDEANLIPLKTEPILMRHRDLSEEKQTTKVFADDLPRVELLETKSDEANVISVEGIDETPDFVEEAVIQEHALLKKTVFVSRLPPETTISDIIDFFKDVARVVRVRLQLTREDQSSGSGFVEFASANEAKKALEKKKGEYFHNQEIFLAVAHHGPPPSSRPNYCLDHKVWYVEEDYPQQESLPIGEDETPPDFVKEAVMKKKTLFIANLSPQTTRILHIIRFFEDVAEVVSVRLIVNHESKHVGYGFVEFFSAYEAKRALEIKNGEYLHDHKILLKGLDETPSSAEAVATVRNKTLFIARLVRRTKISDIINFFKDVGEVVHVRLIVDPRTKHVTFGFVEFASANEAEKALEKKNGEYLHCQEIFLDIVKPTQYPLKSKHCIDHKVWYEDYLQRLLVKEDAAAVEGLDETPDFVEEVASREKTVFVANLPLDRDTLFYTSKMSNLFKNVGKVVRVRLIADDRGKPLGCGFVEFASANEAKKAVQKRNGLAIHVNLAEKIAPYPFQPKYNLADLAEKLWYEDNLRREGYGLRPFKSELKKQLAIFCDKACQERLATTAKAEIAELRTQLDHSER